MTVMDDSKLEKAFKNVSDIEPPDTLLPSILADIGISRAKADAVSEEMTEADVVIMPKRNRTLITISSMALVGCVFAAIIINSSNILDLLPEDILASLQSQSASVIEEPVELQSPVLADPLLAEEHNNDPLIALVGF